jgi:hypothetical protein
LSTFGDFVHIRRFCPHWTLFLGPWITDIEKIKTRAFFRRVISPLLPFLLLLGGKRARSSNIAHTSGSGFPQQNSAINRTNHRRFWCCILQLIREGIYRLSPGQSLSLRHFFLFKNTLYTKNVVENDLSSDGACCSTHDGHSDCI